MFETSALDNEEQTVDCVYRALVASDVLLVTKLIFQEVKINGRDVILAVQRTSSNKYCLILTKRLVLQTIQSNVVCANSANVQTQFCLLQFEKSRLNSSN